MARERHALIPGEYDEKRGRESETEKERDFFIC